MDDAQIKAEAARRGLAKADPAEIRAALARVADQERQLRALRLRRDEAP